MAARKKMASKRKTKRGALTLGDYDYVVEVVSGRVVITGKNGGSMRGKGGRWVKFTSGSGVPAEGFTFSATTFEDNDSTAGPDPADPFDPLPAPAPTFPTRTLRRKLLKPEKGAAQLVFKYTIEVDGAVAADPIIIIEK